ncbi:hypothetical protein BJ138DRAFT_927687 [Hygrophoropsis aurantiaca]|uniref:Uncharacterized protein n=1 Tax=Hygrophoropsis aurantiaca TaxID=72124 RepID=A0ACB7ZUK2_9AGAM|nr:hypothetical protein BJ138DRAFT_927687 [Hygrophoropsis aurantiaca]
MYYRDKNNIAVGVLNDFDLSSTKQSRQGNERTGTIPFMAVKLLAQTSIAGHCEHLYQHDAESFVWVLTWISLAYDNGERCFANGNLEVLFSLPAIQCGKDKSSFLLTGRHEVAYRPSQQENWTLAKRCLGSIAVHMSDDSSSDVLGDDYVYREWLCKHVETHLGIR